MERKAIAIIMWKIKNQAHMVMLGLEEALTSDFASKHPAKEKDAFALTTEQG
jgi:hypothetical protein